VLDGDPAPHSPRKKRHISEYAPGPIRGVQPFAAVQTYRWWKGEYPLRRTPPLLAIRTSLIGPSCHVISVDSHSAVACEIVY